MSSMLLMSLIVFVLSFGIALAFTPLIGRYAASKGIVDRPGPRKIHGAPTPRLGGVVLYAACMLPVGLFYLLYAAGQEFMTELLTDGFYQVFVLVVLSGGILALGICDDIIGLRAWPKLTVEIGVALMLYAAHIRISYLTNPFGGERFELGWFAPVATVLWVVFVTNAINLLDGIDGLASGVSAFVALTLCVRCLQSHNPLAAMLALSVAGAAIGFLRYNFYPARIFMGDSGSLFLGFFLAALSLQAFMKGPTAGALLIPIVALGVPIWDSLLTVTRRTIDGRSIFSADADHVHHRLLYWGLTQRQVALTLYVATVLLCAAAVALMFLKRGEAILILAVLAAFGYVTSRWLGAQLPRLRMSGTFEGNVVDRLEEKLRQADTHDRCWQLFCAAFETLDLADVHFQPVGDDVDDLSGLDRSWQTGEAARTSIRVSVRGAGECLGYLVFSWPSNGERRSLHADSGARLAVLLVRKLGAPGMDTGPVEKEPGERADGGERS